MEKICWWRSILGVLLLSQWVVATPPSDSNPEASQITRAAVAVESVNNVDATDISTPRQNPSAPSQTKPVEVAKSRIFRIMIDPGHGGKDLGAQGLYRISEKKLSLKLAFLVKDELEKIANNPKTPPLEIKLSREKDVYLGLRERAKLANEWGADVFISVHCNAVDNPKAKGFEVYFLSLEATDAAARNLANIENKETHSTHSPLPLSADVRSILSDVQATFHVEDSSRLAEKIYLTMSRQIRANGVGVRQAPFTVLAGTTMPAVLVEAGYVTNSDEAKLLTRKNYLKSLASAISTGIVEFASLARKFGPEG